MNGIELIAAERQRQITKERWDEKHDKEHPPGHLALAGAVYGLDCAFDIMSKHKGSPLADKLIPLLWPWDQKWFKPTYDDPIKQLSKAGALIAAEIDKLQREG